MPKFNPDKYADDYKRRNYDRINLLLPKGTRAKLQQIAQAAGISVNALFNDFVAQLIRDSSATAPEPSGESPEDAEQEPTTPTGPEADTGPED